MIKNIGCLNYLLLILFFTSFTHAIDIDENSSNLSIVDKSSILIDKTKSLSLDEIKEQKFTTNNLTTVQLGYNPNVSLWIKFILHNKTNNFLKKTLEFDTEETESVIMYTGSKVLKGGYLHYDENRKDLNPTFILTLNPNETKIYYLQVRAKIKILKAKVTLWNEIDFIKYDLTDKAYRFILLGMIVVLFIYNAMIFLFTRDKAYLYYVFYLLSLIVLTNYYSGLILFYLLSPTLVIVAVELHTTIATIYLIPCILFTQEFLKTKQFKTLNKLLNLSLYSLPILGILSYDNWILDSNTATFLLLIGVIIVYSGFHALYRGIKEAKYYVLGWSIILISLSFLSLQSLGFYSLQDYSLSYLIEISFVIEALLFSIALAHRINITNEEKSLADQKLIHFQEEEKEHLTIVVEEKTMALKHSLNEKEVLYKELNHRVKNNFMMILSLLKLQISRCNLIEAKDSLKITESRIKSIANLYEMLLLNSDDVNVDTKEYLNKIYRNINLNFQKNIEVEYDIQHNMELDSLIYVGLVFNELITNSFKYAFPHDEGKISITLKKENNEIVFSIKDNGQGFKERRKNSLGLTIVETLIEGQLLGELRINSTEGTEIVMSWKE